MQSALLPENANRGPIWVHPPPAVYPEEMRIPTPQDRARAMGNMAAFSDEVRARRVGREISHGRILVTEMPRMRQCYGWMQFTGKELHKRLGRRFCEAYAKVEKIERYLEDEKDYTAIVYEYIEDGPTDPKVAQPVIDFLWLVGFSLDDVNRSQNWESGVLLDQSAIVWPRGYGWKPFLWGHLGANRIFSKENGYTVEQ